MLSDDDASAEAVAASIDASIASGEFQTLLAEALEGEGIGVDAVGGEVLPAVDDLQGRIERECPCHQFDKHNKVRVVLPCAVGAAPLLHLT